RLLAPGVQNLFFFPVGGQGQKQISFVYCRQMLSDGLHDGHILFTARAGRYSPQLATATAEHCCRTLSGTIRTHRRCLARWKSHNFCRGNAHLSKQTIRGVTQENRKHQSRKSS
ncbi:unnamed protein product, partial [Pylaiella littoralis]